MQKVGWVCHSEQLVAKNHITTQVVLDAFIHRCTPQDDNVMVKTIPYIQGIVLTVPNKTPDYHSVIPTTLHQYYYI